MLSIRKFQQVKEIVLRKTMVVPVFLLFVGLVFFCCTNSMAGMSSMDVGVGVGFDFDDKKYGGDNRTAKQQEESDETTARKKRELGKKEDSRSNDLFLVTRFHYIYSYNNDDKFELFFAPSLHHDFAEDGETSLQYESVRASLFNELTERWSVAVDDSFSLTKDDDDRDVGQEQNGEVPDSAAGDGRADSPPDLSAETDNTRYYRNRLSVDSRYMYGDDSSVEVGGSYDLLREDSDKDESRTNDYDRYSVRVMNGHRFNSKWGTTVQGNYVRGRYKDETVRKPVTETSVAGEEEFVSGDVSEYHFSGSVTNFLSLEDNISVRYGYTRAVYDADALSDSTIHTALLSWYHRFSEVLEGSAGIGPALTQKEGDDDHVGINGFLGLRYLQKLGRYSFELEKTADMKNFDGTDDRGAVDRLTCRLNADRQLGRRLGIDGSLEYTLEEGDKAASAERDEAGELTTAIEEYEKKIWRAALGLRYHLLEEVDAGVKYSFSHLDADREADSYDEHRVIMSLDWDREWLRW